MPLKNDLPLIMLNFSQSPVPYRRPLAVPYRHPLAVPYNAPL